MVQNQSPVTAPQAAPHHNGTMNARISATLFCLAQLAACTVDGTAPGPPQTGTDACTVDGQKRYVLDRMRDVYFWNDLLPDVVDLDAFPTPEALLDYLISFQPLDSFSYIDLAEADAQFFGEGRYEGFGFSTRFEAAGDLRFTRVFAASPANASGFARGQRIIALNGRSIAEIEANEGIGALFSLPSLEFTIRRPDESEFTVTVARGIVTIDPLPQYRVIARPGGASYGYLELVTFISTAEPAFAEVFAAFRQAGVTDVIIDLRYNGGGLVATTELLGDYLGGGAPTGTVFSKTLFNDNNAFLNRTRFFELLAESVNLSRLVVIATANTASASELVTNAMIPHADVSIVGGTTLGKPVGQLGLEFCDKILRPTSFETVNSNDEGRYFDGLPADCPATDDLSVAIGDAADPNIVTALALLDTGACPAPQDSTGMAQKPAARVSEPAVRGAPWREFAGAW
ncbi:MAG: S41 family peptidase [Gammaproteobacteria bacterium]|nr:S41 family peptidase [Gammaproteobacteria bacterium]